MGGNIRGVLVDTSLVMATGHARGDVDSGSGHTTPR